MTGSEGDRAFYEEFHRGDQPLTRIPPRDDFTYGIIFDILEEYLPRDGKVLDVGCATGVLCLFAAARGNAVLGLDIAERAVRVAQENARRLGIAGVEFRRADFLVDPLPTGWDFVICNFVLEHLPDEGLALSRLRRAMDPGGLLYISIPHEREALHRWRLALRGRDRFDLSVGHLRRYTPERLRDLLSKHALEVVHLREIEGPVRHFFFATRLGVRLQRFMRLRWARRRVAWLDAWALRRWGGAGICAIARRLPLREERPAAAAAVAVGEGAPWARS